MSLPFYVAIAGSLVFVATTVATLWFAGERYRSSEPSLVVIRSSKSVDQVEHVDGGRDGSGEPVSFPSGDR